MIYITGVIGSLFLPIPLIFIAVVGSGSPVRHQALYLGVVYAVGISGLYVLTAVGILPHVNTVGNAQASTSRWLLELFVYLCCVGVLYWQIKDVRTKRDQLTDAITRERQRSDNLLQSILPPSIADQLKLTAKTIADYYEQASVMFVDLVGFTEMATGTSPADAVDLLNSIFSDFDDLTERHGLEKIKTIGDSYMVAAGIPLPIENHAARLVKLGLEILNVIERHNEVALTKLRVRIGICSGPAVAGVIGKQKFIYDLWGDTVNIASRMESGGLSGLIQVSASTYHATKSEFEFTTRGEVTLKGKARVTTYLLGNETNTDLGASQESG